LELFIFIRTLRRSVRLLALTTCVGLALGVGVAMLRPKPAAHGPQPTFYSATETLGYDPSAAGQTVSDGVSDLDTVATFATGQTVTDDVGKQLGVDGVNVAQQITTVTRPTTNAIDVVAYAESPREAERLASTFASATTTAYTQKVAAQSAEQATQLSNRLDDLKARRADVAQQLLNPNLSQVDRDTLEAQSDALVNEYRIAYDRFINLASPEVAAPPLFTLARPRAMPIAAATYHDAIARGRLGQNHLDAATAAAVAAPASSGTSLPTGPIPLGILGALAGLGVGVGIALIRARFDPKLRSRDQFEEAFGLPVLGGVPMFTGAQAEGEHLVVAEEPYSRVAEVFRSVRATLLLLGSDDPHREGALVVMISSAQPKEGKSTNCANLAATFAEAGRAVLAVNCDYRRPTLHRYFGVEDRPGEIQDTSIRGLALVTNVTKRGSSPGVVAEQQRSFVEAQRPNFDVIVLDTSPLVSTSDPVDVVAVADFVVVVGRPGQTEREHARQAVEILDRHRASIAGLLLTGIDDRDKYYYEYYYGLDSKGRGARRGGRDTVDDPAALDVSALEAATPHLPASDRAASAPASSDRTPEPTGTTSQNPTSKNPVRKNPVSKKSRFRGRKGERTAAAAAISWRPDGDDDPVSSAPD
jgi:Mrp family chromosome partitioning ATPase/capsular polysaccharide biosynthesis protein